MAAQQAGIEAVELSAVAGDAHRGRGLAQRNRTENQRVGLDRALDVRPGWRHSGPQPLQQGRNQRAPLARAQERCLQQAGVERAKLGFKVGDTGRSAAIGGQVEAGGSLDRAVAEGDRVPAHSVVLQVERGLRDEQRVDQVIGLPVGVAQGRGSGEVVGGGQGLRQRRPGNALKGSFSAGIHGPSATKSRPSGSPASASRLATPAKPAR